MDNTFKQDTAATSTIDDFGKMLLPLNVRTRLGWLAGDTLATTLEPTTGILVLRKNDAANSDMEIDEMGRIHIPQELRTKAGWVLGERIELNTSTAKAFLALWPA